MRNRPLLASHVTARDCTPQFS